MPSIVVEKLDNEPTDDDLDADIRAAGLDYIIAGLSAGSAQDNFREMLRTNARMARYEKGKVLEGVVLIELDGKHAFIHPHLDTPWNFSRVTSFLDDVFGECSKLLT